MPPKVYFTFTQLYGQDDSPDLCRYTVDIYDTPVPAEHLVGIQRDAKVRLITALLFLFDTDWFGKAQSAVEVNNIRTQWIEWDSDMAVIDGDEVRLKVHTFVD